MWVATPIPVSADAAMTPSDEAIRAALMDFALRRGAGKSFCPSEPARALAGRDDWPSLMPRIRGVAAELQDVGALAASQKGQPVRADTARGPIRLSLP